MQICIYFSADNIIQLVALLVAFLTLWLGYRTYLRNQLKTKQLNNVCELINQIHNDYNMVFFNNQHGDKRAWYFTLFDIAESKEFDELDKFYTLGEEDRDWATMGEKKLGDLLRWNFFKYYNNPLIPKSIAESLRKFNIGDWTRVTYKDIKETKCILMGNKSIGDDTFCLYYKDKKTAKEFKQICIDLRTAILEWAKGYGIKDLNISTSHHKKP